MSRITTNFQKLASQSPPIFTQESATRYIHSTNTMNTINQLHKGNMQRLLAGASIKENKKLGKKQEETEDEPYEPHPLLLAELGSSKAG
jgi:hypothetical protein